PRRILEMPETLIKTELKRKGREIVARTRGSSHGPITRLVSPSDLGHALKPFVFLDYFDIDPKRMPPIGFHPHSGIDTVTVVLRGQLSYQETSGRRRRWSPSSSTPPLSCQSIPATGG